MLGQTVAPIWLASLKRLIKIVVLCRDGTDRLTFAEADARSGLGTILIDRLMPEIAFKLGRAPKYGA